MLDETPEGSNWDRFTLIIGQVRHLHIHSGMIMAVSVIITGVWAEVIGLEENFNEIKKD